MRNCKVLWCIPVVCVWWWLKLCVMHLQSQMPISVLHTEFQAYYVYECFGTYFVSSYNLWKADQLESKKYSCMERYAPYSRPYFRGAWQLLCAASAVTACSQGHYRCLLRSLFCLGSHWKLTFALNIHIEDNVRGVSI